MKTCVVITGSTGGIGSALVRRLLPEDEVDYVLGVCRNGSKWDNIFQTVKDIHKGRLVKVLSEVEELKCTLADVLERLAADAEGERFKVILILTAFSIQPAKRALAIQEKELWDNLYGNLQEPIRQIQTVEEVCRKAGAELRVVYLGSGASRRPMQGWSLYCAGKSFMNLFLQTLALEEGIRTVVFDPGVVDTAMQEQIRNMPEEIFDQVQVFRDYQTQKRLHTPEEVADYMAERYVLGWGARALEERYRRTGQEPRKTDGRL